MALEFEILSWRRFRKSLVGDEEKEAFDELMDMCRNNAMAGGAAVRPVLFEAALMTILLSQTKRITALEAQLNELLARKAGLKVTEG
jgi:hypothetical protein